MSLGKWCAAGGLVALIACSLPPGPAASQSAPPSAQEREVTEAVRTQIAVAQAVAGDSKKFAMLARPFGPLNLTMGEVAGAADPEEADSLQSFAFGAAGAAAKVDPAKLANDFHCGPPCAKRRKAELLKTLPQARAIAASFSAANYRVISLWPGAVRVDDQVFGGAYHLERSPLLRLAVGTVGPPAAGSPPADAARIQAELSQTAATSVVRDEFGGIRLIHRDSIGDNEAGLLFATEEQAGAVDKRTLANGGSYVGLEPAAPGVYFYIRS